MVGLRIVISQHGAEVHLAVAAALIIAIHLQLITCLQLAAREINRTAIVQCAVDGKGGKRSVILSRRTHGQRAAFIKGGAANATGTGKSGP